MESNRGVRGAVNDRLRVNLRQLSLPVMALISTLFSSVVESADGGNTWTLQYSPGDKYESAIGFGLYGLESDGFGFYGNFLITIADREPHYDSLTVDSFGDPVTEHYQDIVLFSVGATRDLTDHISAYAGVGYGWATGIAQKDDPTHILADDGKYYVDDPSNDESGVNTNVGLMIRTAGPVFEVGYHSFSESIYLGIGGTF